MNKPASKNLNQFDDDFDNSLYQVKKFKPSKVELDVRVQARMDIRLNEGVTCKIIGIRGDLNLDDVQVYDLSSFGICVKILHPKKIKCEVNSIVELHVEISGEFSFKTLAKVCWISFSSDKTCFEKIGFQYLYNYFEPEEKFELVPVAKSFPLIGYVYRPLIFNERTAIKVNEISKSRLKFTIFENDIIIFPDMDLEIRFAVQTTAGSTLKIKVLKINALEGGQVEVFAIIEKLNSKLEADIVNFFLQSLESTPQQLKQAGFSIKKVSNNFRFKFVKTHEEYLEVLKLRFLAYKDAGKVLDTQTLADMATPFDEKSRIIVGYHGEKLVASSMIFFPTENSKFESEAYVEGGYSFPMPNRNSMVEIARLCTLPEYRGSDLLKRIFEHTYKLIITAGRRHIVTSCDDTLWLLYKRMGFRKTGQTYNHKKLNNKLHYILMGDSHVGLHSRLINFFVWAYLYGEMTDYMLRKKTVSTDIVTKLKVVILKIALKILGSKY